MSYIKMVELNETYNFVVDKFSFNTILECQKIFLNSQNFKFKIRIFKPQSTLSIQKLYNFIVDKFLYPKSFRVLNIYFAFLDL
jgi:hypothetical protein